MTPLQAELYALTHRGNPGDAKFYARACSRAASVLELGVGYGRLLPTLASAARSVVGLDREPALLRAARRAVKTLTLAQQRRIQLVRGDMQAFALGRTFERIVLPYNGLYCLPSQRALLACLRCVREHLAPGGEFLFDVWAADRFHAQSQHSAYRDDDLPILSIFRGEQGWDVFEKSRLRKAEQRLDVVYTYVQKQRDARVTIGIDQRYLRSRELFALLAEAGLEPCRVEGGFAGQRFGARSDELVVRARALAPSRGQAAPSRTEGRARPTPKGNRLHKTPTGRALGTKGQDSGLESS